MYRERERPHLDLVSPLPNWYAEPHGASQSNKVKKEGGVVLVPFDELGF